MRQALHILKKDMRFLHREIAFLLLLAAMLAWSETHFREIAGLSEILMILAANYVIARLIHAEPIPGHNQFWITRPYRWKSLLGAKALFILIFFNLPVFAAQCYMIVAQQFSFSASLPGLLWSQVLMLVCISLPVACLASLTDGMISFLLVEFIVGAAILVGEGLLHVRLRWLTFLPVAHPGPGAVDWFRELIVMTLMTCLAAFVLRFQYKTRRTEDGRKWAIAGTVAAGVLFLSTPWSLALAVQSGLSKQPFDGSSLSMGLAPVVKSSFPPHGRGPAPVGQISLPIALKGIPDGQELAADALSVTLEGSDGRTWSSGILTPNLFEGGKASQQEVTLIGVPLGVDPSFFADESAHPVTVHAKLYLTLFGNPHSMTIPVQDEPVNVMDGLQCFVGLFKDLDCRSIFRWPRRRVYGKTGEFGDESVIRAVSYSPFPAEFGFNPVEQHSFQLPPPPPPTLPGAAPRPPPRQATITTREPLSHFQADAAIPNIALTDYTEDAKRRAMMPPLPPRPGALR